MEVCREGPRRGCWSQLRQVERQCHGLPAIAIDYVDPRDRALTRATAPNASAAAGHRSLGGGRRARHAWASAARGDAAAACWCCYDGREATAINYTNAHRYVADAAATTSATSPSMRTSTSHCPTAALAHALRRHRDAGSPAACRAPAAASRRSGCVPQIQGGMKLATAGRLRLRRPPTPTSSRLGLRLADEALPAASLKVARARSR
ncbi:MAG: hypothetical protein MZV65_43865 [Chromatiales bacterium]|nr:hypothetical protein [Chromatiales bacterium]